MRVAGQNSDDAIIPAVDFFDGPVHQDLSAQLSNESSHFFPHLAWTVFGIKEALDERCFNILLRDVALGFREHLFQNVSDGFVDREALDPLCSPLRADFFTVDSPDLFRVGLEKREIKLAAEAVDEKLLEVGFIANGKENRAQIAEAYSEGFD